MRDQYAGDITDFLKFSYIRTVVPLRSKLGVAWYYIPTHDGRRDGCHIEYQQEEKWRDLDAHLHSELATLGQQRSISALQELKIWQSQTQFHDEPVEFVRSRVSWAQNMVKCLQSSDVIFADPDNGLSREGKVSRKSATLSEISHLAQSGRAVILIRFPSRQGTHLEQLEKHHLLLADYKPITVRTCVHQSNSKGSRSPRIRWFTLMNPSNEMRESVRRFASRLKTIEGAKVELSEGV
jgi:hypothetical protein